eukprot:GHVS01063380.1.p1 GENE.GHVS01063380.1~~GHVS01063380.1.p1  ORF type:complete len:282 (+),score=40.62 GHVS01063380.1:271-1116(+)
MVMWSPRRLPPLQHQIFDPPWRKRKRYLMKVVILVVLLLCSNSTSADAFIYSQRCSVGNINSVVCNSTTISPPQTPHCYSTSIRLPTIKHTLSAKPTFLSSFISPFSSSVISSYKSHTAAFYSMSCSTRYLPTTTTARSLLSPPLSQPAYRRQQPLLASLPTHSLFTPSLAAPVLRDTISTAIRLWYDHNKTVLMAGVFVLRFFKLLLYARYLLEWLPQVNPYLQPFSTVYSATDSYMAVFQHMIPPVLGIDLSGLCAWLFLEFAESVLSGRPEVAAAASL